LIYNMLRVPEIQIFLILFNKIRNYKQMNQMRKVFLSLIFSILLFSPVVLSNSSNALTKATNDISQRTRADVCGDRLCGSSVYQQGQQSFRISQMNEPTIDLTVSHLEITQAIQDEDNSVPLVKGKKTWVRIYVQTDEKEKPIPNVTAKLHKLDSNERIVSTINPYSNPITVSPTSFDYQRRHVDSTINFELPNSWAKGQLALKVELNPVLNDGSHAINEKNYKNNSHGPLKFSFIKTKPLKVNFHSVTVDRDWCDKPTKSDLKRILDDFVLRVFPVASFDINQDSSIEVDNVPGPNGNGLWLLEGRLLWEQCKNYPTNCLFGSLRSSPERIEFGLVCSQNPPGRSSSGMGYQSKAWAYPDPEIVAHEIAHAKDVWHVPITPTSRFDGNDGSENPRWYKKVDSHTITCQDSRPAHDVAGLSTGQWFEDRSYPDYDRELHRPSIGEFGFDGKRIYEPELFSDFLSYCSTDDLAHDGKWVSPHTYKKLFAKFSTS
jgi:hypothetical protein